MQHTTTIIEKKMRTTLIAIMTLAISCNALAANPKIDQYAVSEVTKQGYPSTYAKWGASGVKEINKLQPMVAEKIAANPECDRVDLVALSDERSVPKKEIVFFVDCRNGKRFYVNKNDVNNSGPLQSQDSKTSAIDDSSATDGCIKAIKKQLANPLTFSRNFGTTSVYRAKTTGNIAVEFTFEAKNNLGGELPYKARCIITDRGIEEATIRKTD